MISKDFFLNANTKELFDSNINYCGDTDGIYLEFNVEGNRFGFIVPMSKQDLIEYFGINEDITEDITGEDLEDFYDEYYFLNEDEVDFHFIKEYLDSKETREALMNDYDLEFEENYRN